MDARPGRAEGSPSTSPPGAAGLEASIHEELQRRREVWGPAFRAIAAAFFLPVAISQSSWRFALATSGPYLLASLLCLLLVGRARGVVVSRLLMPLVDVAMISVPIYAFGAASSHFVMLYLFPILGITVGRGPRAGAWVLALALAAYGALVALQAAGAIPEAPLLDGPPAPAPVGALWTFVIASSSLAGSYFFVAFAMDRLERHAAGERAARLRSAQLQQQLDTAARLEAIGRLAGGVAHDFNNLLTAILGNARFVKNTVTSGSEPDHDLEQILVAARRAQDLTSKLLAFSRQQTVRPVALDLNARLLRFASLLSRMIGEDVELRLDLADDLWPIEVDPGHVEQVVMNLVVNARDAMTGGGEVTIETANASMDEAACRGAVGLAPGDFVALRVRDTGAGMDAATLARIFEPFFTTKGAGKGTGLGLAIVYGLVTQGGGGLRVESTPGQGSVFTVYWPRAHVATRVVEPAAAAPATGREKVLLVEDEALVRRVARRILAAAGYEVIEASGGEEALRLAAEQGQTVDLLLTDVIMPGMNGRELAERFRERYPGARVLLMSGYTADVIGLDADPETDAPRLRLLEKPFDRESLLAAVRAVLDERA